MDVITKESPFEQYCDLIDRKAYTEDWLDSKHDAIAWEIYNREPLYFSKSLIEDFKFRARFKGNILASVEGPPWSGKSLFAGRWILELSEIFGMPFSWNNLTWLPEELETKLIKSKSRETIWVDEKQKKRVGLGSRTTDLNLLDFEEMGRKTQKNIIWCSPEVGRSNHYFYFKAYDLERINNQKCEKCEKADKCFRLPSQTKTLCEIPFFERLGYPKHLIFRLKTYSKLEERPLVRAYVQVPIPSPDFIKEYEIHKDKFIKKLEKQEPDDSFSALKEIAAKIIKERKEDLYYFNRHGEYVPVQNKIVKSIVYDEIGMRRYPNEMIEIIRNIISNAILSDGKILGFNKKKKKRLCT